MYIHQGNSWLNPCSSDHPSNAARSAGARCAQPSPCSPARLGGGRREGDGREKGGRREEGVSLHLHNWLKSHEAKFDTSFLCHKQVGVQSGPAGTMPLHGRHHCWLPTQEISTQFAGTSSTFLGLLQRLALGTSLPKLEPTVSTCCAAVRRHRCLELATRTVQTIQNLRRTVEVLGISVANVLYVTCSLRLASIRCCVRCSRKLSSIRASCTAQQKQPSSTSCRGRHSFSPLMKPK